MIDKMQEWVKLDSLGSMAIEREAKTWPANRSSGDRPARSCDSGEVEHTYNTDFSCSQLSHLYSSQNTAG